MSTLCGAELQLISQTKPYQDRTHGEVSAKKATLLNGENTFASAGRRTEALPVALLYVITESVLISSFVQFEQPQVC